MKQSMKNKLKIFASIPIVVGIFLLIYASLGIVYFNRHDKSHELTSQIALKQAVLRKPAPDIKQLNSQLSDAKAELATITTSLPYPGQGIEICYILVDLGRTWNVEISNIEAYPALTPTDGASGPILPYSLTIQGSQNDALSFISDLIQGRELLQGMEVQDITVQRVDSADDIVTIVLNLNIHTWPDLTSETQNTSQTSGVKK
jgi:hypothetical protein